MTAQASFRYRFDWGLEGLAALAPGAAVVVVVDVLSFTTAVDIACARGATVIPADSRRADLDELATRHAAELAHPRSHGSEGPTLSPASLIALAGGTRLLLPSPNGGTVAAAAGATQAVVFAASLRNATAVARAARARARQGPIAVVPAGERWGGDGALRVAVEDLLGAGAVLAALDPSGSVSDPRCSPEAAAARGGFIAARPRLREHLDQCTSGRELIERGYAYDVALASALDISRTVPVLRAGGFVAGSVDEA